MAGNPHIEAIDRFEQEQRSLFKELDDALEQDRRKRQRESDAFVDWAIRRATPNPKFDDDWKID